MVGRLKKSVAMILVAAMCLTQGTGSILAAQMTEKKETASVETVSEAAAEVGEKAEEEAASGVESEEGKMSVSGDEKAEEGAGTKETAVSAEKEPAAGGDNMEESAGGSDPAMALIKNISVNSVDATGGKGYSRRISIDCSASDDVVNAYSDWYYSGNKKNIRWIIIYKEGEEGSLSFNGGNQSINKDVLTGAGWKVWGLGNVVKKGYLMSNQTYSFAGEEIADGLPSKGLKPNTTYSYYLAINNYNDDSLTYYGKTEKMTFTTGAGIDSSAIGVSNLEQNYTLTGKKVIVTISNPNDENILGFYYADAGKTEVDPLVLSNNKSYFTDAVEDEDNDHLFYSNLSNEVDISSRNHIYAIVYTGTAQAEPKLSLVDMGEVDIEGPAPLSSDTVSVSYEADIATITARIDYDCGDYDLDLSSLAIRISDNNTGKYTTYSGSYWDENDNTIRRWRKKDDGKGYYAIINFTGFWYDDEKHYLSPDTTYNLKTILGTMEEDSDEFTPIAEKDVIEVRTRTDRDINISEFDENFLELLGEDENIVISDDTIKQSRLDRVTEVYSNYNDDITSIRGVKHLRNLSLIEITNSSLTDISEIKNNEYLREIYFSENRIESLPDLSGLSYITTLDLNRNFIPDSQISEAKLPKSLEYSYYEDLYTRTRKAVADEMKDAQHKEEDYTVKTYYQYNNDNKYPFEVSFKRGELEARSIKDTNIDSTFYYLLEAAEQDSESTAATRVGIFRFKSLPEEDIEEAKTQLKTDLSLDEIYDISDKAAVSQYDFKVDSVAGINSQGSHAVNWKLHKVGVRKNGNGYEEQGRHLIWDKTANVTHAKGEITGVTIEPATLNLTLNRSAKLTAKVTANSDYLDKSVTWASDNTNVATVDAEGNVTGVGEGSAVITATSKYDGTKKGSCTVTVKKVPPTGLSLTTEGGEDTTFVGSSLTLKPVFTPSNSYYDESKVTYTTSDKGGVIGLSGNKVTGLKVGTAKVTASYTVSEGSSPLTADIDITVRRSADAEKTFHSVKFVSENGTEFYTEKVLDGQPVKEPSIKAEKTDCIFIGWGQNDSLFDFTTPIYSDITLTALFKKNKIDVTENSGSGMDAQAATDLKKDGDVIKGDIYLVKGQTYKPEDGGKKWKSDNAKIAKVAANGGTITAKGKGSTAVGNDSHSYTVHVVEPSIAVSKVDGKDSDVKPLKVSILVGQTAEYKVEGITENTEKYPVSWYSSNIKVATVTDGVVTAIAKGSANIIAYVGGKAYNGKVKVTDVIKTPARINGEGEIDINALKATQLKFSNFTANKSTWEAVDEEEKLEVLKRDNQENATAWRNSKIEITNTGKITGIGEGTTKIKGTDTRERTVTVTVNVKVVNARATLFINKEKNTTLKYANVKNKDADWTSMNPECVSVVNTGSAKGKVKGEAVGSSTVTCSVNKANDLVFETLVYCEDPKLKADAGGKMKLDSKKTSGTLKLKAGDVYVIETEDISQKVVYKSNNKKGVFVDENGVIYARVKGKATVSAKVNGKTLKIKVEVE